MSSFQSYVRSAMSSDMNIVKKRTYYWLAHHSARLHRLIDPGRVRDRPIMKNGSQESKVDASPRLLVLGCSADDWKNEKPRGCLISRNASFAYIGEGPFLDVAAIGMTLALLHLQ